MWALRGAVLYAGIRALAQGSILREILPRRESLDRMWASSEKVRTRISWIPPLPYVHIIPNGSYNFEPLCGRGNLAYNTLQ
jgi:hypothetical protein